MKTAEPTTRERPILFSAPMIRAIIDGRKTQTRRIIKPQPPRVEDVVAKSGSSYSWYREDDAPAHRPFRPVGPVWAVRELDRNMANGGLKCPYGVPGDRLWVRETWRPILSGIKHGGYDYRADDPSASGEGFIPWKPSIHMPRAASRLTLQIESVRVERLGEISEADARAEGMGFMEPNHFAPPGGGDWMPHDAAFQLYWNAVNGKRAGCDWKASPFVWVVGFRKVEGA